ncbi:ROK family protein [Brochothrix campestris]|uniref:Transcriptional regulator/sugar kinase n=1 Tax=Brochothrix campestris FSL F6-1037 TaxID=1265861 RepID=W7DAB3_9LIST|nr:ROK family protein [Brochothrix campestris]EUJ42203.1 transcriptional regulator/sugar kinase [Brochothrix campestris FSL F6-1037]
MKHLLTIDIGGSAIKYSLWQANSLGEIESEPTHRSWSEMKAFFLVLKERYNGITGVAISCPGAVNTAEGVIYGLSAVPYIHRFTIKAELANLFGVPVTIQNDANCAALAEVWRGNANDVNNSLLVILGSGIGGAVVTNKQLHVGKHLFGGEFGLMILNSETGETWSQLASPVNLARAYSACSQQSTSGKELFDLASIGDVRATAFVERFYHQTSVGLFNLITAFDPERVLIGGAISKRPGLIARLTTGVEQLITTNNASGLTVDIQPCRYFNDANLIGAVAQYRLESGDPDE